MRIALVSPYSWTYQGGVNRHVEALAEQFIARGDHVRVLAPWDPPGPHQQPPAPLPTRVAGGSRLPGPARTHDRLRGEWRRLESLVLPGGPDRPTSRASRRQLRRRPRARAARAARRLGRNDLPRGAGRRDLPRLLHQGLPEPHRDPARRSPSDEPADSADRRLRGGRLDGAPLVRRRVHDRPERRRHRGRAAGSEGSERRAPAALRRPRGGAQGPAGPARRVPGAGRARAVEADGGRCRSGGDLPPGQRPGSDEPHRRARQGLGLDSVAPARRGGPALCAIPGRRELRHGADRGDGGRHRRRRFRDRRLQRRRHQRCRRHLGAPG